jgi:hypothetical protein
MVFSRGFLIHNPYQIAYRVAGDYDLYLRAKRVAIITTADSRPLTGIEVDGVASGSPMTSYREYLAIAHDHLRGHVRIASLIRISVRALIIITLKKFIPRRWFHLLRGI